MLDKLFNLDVDANVGYSVGERLRRLIHAMLATQLMYYDARHKAGEMERTLMRIKEAWVVVFRPNDMNVDACLREAHNKIIAYGESIKAKFDIDNLHLRSRELASDSTRVVTAVQHLQKTTQVTIGDALLALSIKLEQVEGGSGSGVGVGSGAGSKRKR